MVKISLTILAISFLLLLYSEKAMGAESKEWKEKFSLQDQRVKNHLIQAFSKADSEVIRSDFDQSECTKLLMNLSNYFLTYNQTLEKMYRNSGKDYNDLGRYDDCNHLKNFHYILATIPKALPIPMNIGLCVPKNCSVTDFITFKPFLIDAINNIIPDLFDDIKGFDPNTQLVSENLQFQKSLELNEEVSKVSFGAITMILIILFFVITTIVSTAILWYRRKQKQKKREARQSRRAERIQATNPEGSQTNENSGGGSSRRRRRQEGMIIKNENYVEESPLVDSPSRQHKYRKKKCTHRFLNCFSLSRNTRAIFKRRSSEQDSELEIFNGIRVISLAVVILGNTFFYILKGPLQNLEILESWMSDSSFTMVISADLVVDIFFWLSSFLTSYLMLCTMQENDGMLGKLLWIYLNKLMKLWPLYAFTLFFYWKFLALFGGSGPIFFQYETQLQCSKYWYLHLLFLNNLIPWSSMDQCMHWTWFMADYFQFFLIVPFLVKAYYNRRKYFWISIAVLTFICILISMIIILVNDLSPSYFTYRDEYWSIYYVKPYSRLPAFLIGVIAGCSYFTFKRDAQESTIISSAFEQVQARNLIAILWNVIGTILQIMMIILLQIINNSPNKTPLGVSCLYLLFQRPFFITGFTMTTIPILVQNQFTIPIGQFLSHEFFVPLSRLSYGAYLSLGIFMQFRIYNSENGYWGNAFDAFLFFLAFIFFSYIFSFLTFVFFEMPVSLIYKDIVARNPTDTQNYVKKKRIGSRRKKNGIAEEELGEDLIDNGSQKRSRVRGEEIEAEDLEQEDSTAIFEEERRSLQYRDNGSGADANPSIN